MNYTNKANLPDEVFKVLTKERYKGGDTTDYSVTTLKTPPRIVQLERRHWDELEEDAIDNLWSMFGQMAHNLLEEHGSDDSMTEERVYINIFDRCISGQVDHYKDGVITDYKVTSAWSLVYGSRVKEWEEQLNMHAYLLGYTGHEVKQIRIIAILRDWDKNKALQGGGYPDSPIQIIPITLWDIDTQKKYIETRVWLHKESESFDDDNLPTCFDEDMWCQPNKYAVMKEGRKTAVRVFDTEDEAKHFIDFVDDVNRYNLYSIQIRQGKRTRCESYCKVNKFCNQYQQYLKEKE